VVPLESKVYGDKRLLRVWLPSGYSSSTASAKRYPVLYLFDGQFLFDRCTSQPFPDEWHVDDTLTELIEKKAVQPLIVVGIDNPVRVVGRTNTLDTARCPMHRKSCPRL
jgi:enterochelin esterase-like enzyme